MHQCSVMTGSSGGPVTQPESLGNFFRVQLMNGISVASGSTPHQFKTMLFI